MPRHLKYTNLTFQRVVTCESTMAFKEESEEWNWLTCEFWNYLEVTKYVERTWGAWIWLQ